MSIQNAMQERFFRWIDKHVPKVTQHTLTLHNVYVFPSKLGLAYLLVACLVWVLGTNYQNNLVLAFVFLMISVFVISILHTFLNLNRITVRYTGASPVFVGDTVEINFELAADKNHYGIRARWQEESRWSSVDVVDDGSSIQVRKAAVSAPMLAKKRGWIKPDRLLLESYFPHGLIRCWTWLNWDVHILVYPKPIEVPEPESLVVAQAGTDNHPVSGGEDFSGLRNYQSGDSLKKVAWKIYAKGKGLYTKEFDQQVSKELWIDFDNIVAPSLELKLSGVAYWIMRYHQQGVDYGLKLTNQEFKPDSGDEHMHRLLTAIATFDYS